MGKLICKNCGEEIYEVGGCSRQYAHMDAMYHCTAKTFAEPAPAEPTRVEKDIQIVRDVVNSGDPNGRIWAAERLLLALAEKVLL